MSKREVEQRWYVTTVFEGVTYVIQWVDPDGWIEWVPFDQFASVFQFSSFSDAFSCCEKCNTGDGRSWSYFEGGYSILGNNQSIYIGKTLAQELYARSKLLKSDELLWIED